MAIDTEPFRYQFVIARANDAIIGDGSESLGGWVVNTGAALTTSRLIDANGRLHGILLGLAVDDKGQLITGDWTGAPDPDLGWQAVTDWIEGLTGRYGLLIRREGAMRFYTDPFGTIGAVHDPETRRLASSLALCLTRPIAVLPGYDHAAVAEGKALYTLFDTRDTTARRLNPNCFLDLDRFVEIRFWPRPSSIALHQGDLVQTYDCLARRTRAVFAALNARHRVWLPLSGGQDSRLLLAMAGDEARNIDRAFTHISNYANRIDAEIASQLARAAGVDHEVHDRRQHRTNHAVAAADEKTFRQALGFPMPAWREIGNGLHRRLPLDAVILRGHGTDLLRAVFSFRIGRRARRNTAWQLRRLRPGAPSATVDPGGQRRFQKRYEAWRTALPDWAEKNSSDLMFQEIYFSSTIGCTFPAYWRAFMMSPFCGRRQIGMSMAIDEALRRTSAPVFDIVYRMNPALHDVPFDFENRGPIAQAKIDRIADPKINAQITQARRAATRERAAGLAAGTHSETVNSPNGAGPG